LAPLGHYKSSKNEIEMRKLWPPKVEKVKNSKKQTTEGTKANSQTPQKIFVCCSIVIRIQR